MRRRKSPSKPSRFEVLVGGPGEIPPSDPDLQERELADCPECLPAEAQPTWRWLVGVLRAMGHLALADKHALIAYCQTWVRWRSAEEFIAKHGETYPIRDETGKVRYMQQFPQVAIARNLLLIIRAYQEEFGMTPAARWRKRCNSNEVPGAKALCYFG